MERGAGAAPAPGEPDPEPGGDGEGLRRPRAGHAGERHAGARRAAERGHAGAGGAGEQHAYRRAALPLRRGGGVPGPEGEPELPFASERAGGYGGQDRLRAHLLQCHRARLQRQGADGTDRSDRGHVRLPAGAVLRGVRGGAGGGEGAVLAEGSSVRPLAALRRSGPLVEHGAWGLSPTRSLWLATFRWCICPTTITCDTTP